MTPKWHTHNVLMIGANKCCIPSQPHTLNGHKNDDEEGDNEKNEGQLWKKRGGLVCGMQKGMVLLVIGNVQSG